MERTIVFDETGNRPQDIESSGFGVGAVLFPVSLERDLAIASKKIGTLVEKADFKYKHVRENENARRLFIDVLNGYGHQVHVYGFYSHGSAVARCMDLTRQAATAYDTAFSHTFDPKNGLLDDFMGFMTSQIACHAGTFGYSADIFWDRRTDLSFMEKSFHRHLMHFSEKPQYGDVHEKLHFRGEAKGCSAQIARLAGVVAGDVKQYFLERGTEIWAYLDPSGLIGESDPHIHPGGVRPPCVADLRHDFCDSTSNVRDSKPAMIRCYYKRLLSNEHGEHLISFGDPYGHFGILGIRHSRNWKIYQLPD